MPFQVSVTEIPPSTAKTTPVTKPETSGASYRENGAPCGPVFICAPAS